LTLAGVDDNVDDVAVDVDGVDDVVGVDVVNDAVAVIDAVAVVGNICNVSVTDSCEDAR